MPEPQRLSALLLLVFGSHVAMHLSFSIGHELGFASRFTVEFLTEFGEEFITGFDDGLVAFDHSIFNQP